MSTAYVEPKRPRPWGPILTTQPQEHPPVNVTLKPREQFFAEFREVNAFYAAPEGLKRPGGMVIDTAVPVPADTEAMAAWGYDLMLGASPQSCIARIRESEEWKAKHPNPSNPGGGDVSVPGALHIDGTTFRNADGTIWKYRMVTAFSAFQDFLAGNMSKLDAYAQWTRSVGGNGWRVFYTWDVTKFNPIQQTDTATLVREMGAFRTYLDTQGLRGHHTVLCDQIDGSFALLTPGDQSWLIELVRGAMKGHLIEAMNEPWKNGGYAMSGRFTHDQFLGCFAARGSHQDGERPDAPGSILDWTTEHTPRDVEWPRKAKNLLETSVQGIGTFPATRKPAVAGEPIGIWEQDVPGSRTSNASDVADYFAVAELFGAGACLHGDGSTLQRCNLPGPNAQKCAEWADAARRAIPADAQLGSYTRGGLEDSPLEHDDALALRTFAMISGNRATAVVVRPKGTWTAKARNGWTIQTIGGPNGHIIGLTR